jgi:hypothetical protein
LDIAWRPQSKSGGASDEKEMRIIILSKELPAYLSPSITKVQRIPLKNKAI